MLCDWYNGKEWGMVHFLCKWYDGKGMVVMVMAFYMWWMPLMDEWRAWLLREAIIWWEAPAEARRMWPPRWKPLTVTSSWMGSTTVVVGVVGCASRRGDLRAGGVIMKSTRAILIHCSSTNKHICFLTLMAMHLHYQGKQGWCILSNRSFLQTFQSSTYRQHTRFTMVLAAHGRL